MNEVSAFIRVADYIRKEIDQELTSIGLLCRVFGRGKSAASLRSKLGSLDKYSPTGKLIQDAIGIRVVLYFQEDVEVADAVLRRRYQCDDASSTIDKPVDTVFSVSRYNLVFRLAEEYYRDIGSPTVEFPIDRAFEVQIRTILSEGWHEVEHDLRYKRKADWINSDDLSRGLNGVLATLETAEWSMRKIFDDLAYKHYKSRKWDALIHSVLRMRITTPLSNSICVFLESNTDAARKLIRINRFDLLSALAKMAPRIPLTADNMIFVWNRVSLRNTDLTNLTPRIIAETMDNSEI
ncbi:ppGpp synthetase/RelA/SpoT-type nucleotidyltransferase [Rhodanobacter sp. K2T2]|uniref:RelA/SpoT protein n=1 Tax=Rhodanobacter sp. K2T2 TaxID=2723085 RepID=UPI0015CB10E5|nr:RelA/SpoT protein [Rhodanobacter sp. K2T2]NYE27675.1 ppGpp synthetase/RelA/SpoT-type nucleotidyltransferase [Rhodanobacter sp. K2T2]